jgi:hypothetical protein
MTTPSYELKISIASFHGGIKPMRYVNASFVLLIFASLFGPSPRDNVPSAKDQSTHGSSSEFITAEVHGTLQKDPITPGQPNIYFIVVKAPPFFEENRVWVLRTEDKDRALDQQLMQLMGRQVVAKGRLKQTLANSRGAVPALGMYLEASGTSFTITAAT